MSLPRSGGVAARLRPGPSTLAVHAGSGEPVVGQPVVTPVYQSSTFFNDPGGTGEILYTRYGNNPNHLALEARLAALEGAAECVVTGSGMAAIATALLSCVGSGDHVLAAEGLYGGTRLLLERELVRLGVRSSYADFTGSGWPERLEPRTRAVLLEVPANPLLRVVDLPAIAALTRRAGIPLLVDSTFATPINLRPLEHGADLVVHSATKYLGGHSDVTAGAVLGDAERIAIVRQRVQLFGPALDPHAAWLVERGIKTLALRVERQNRNAQVIAEWLEAHPAVREVHYPGLPSHSDHAVAARLLDGFGGMLSVLLAGGGAAASRLLERLRLLKVAPSLGGVETLVSEPRCTSHAALSAEERRAASIPDGLVRLSLGIEDVDDILADLEAALARP
jgi:cystathionine beta-lyase/cystathionine gamma-synthase